MRRQLGRVLENVGKSQIIVPFQIDPFCKGTQLSLFLLVPEYFIGRDSVYNCDCFSIRQYLEDRFENSTEIVIDCYDRVVLGKVVIFNAPSVNGSEDHWGCRKQLAAMPLDKAGGRRSDRDYQVEWLPQIKRSEVLNQQSFGTLRRPILRRLARTQRNQSTILPDELFRLE